ncbi:MAG: Hsp20/alpha crystallin family protein [Chitinispirillaceae bacterium]|nr:Hsp20/alpha crystallin family protein [Chitinispirillaceae bacterium]
MATELEKREKQEVGTTAAEQLRHSGPAYSPDVDIYVSDDEARFIVELPGVNKGDVTIEVDETESLIIRGKTNHREPEDAVFRQYRVGDYYRAFQLSDEYDKDKISAKLENGLLEITIPKKEEAKPKRIEIKA